MKVKKVFEYSESNPPARLTQAELSRIRMQKRYFSEDNVNDIIDMFITQTSDYDMVEEDEYPYTPHNWVAIDRKKTNYFGYKIGKYKTDMDIIIALSHDCNKSNFYQDMSKFTNRLSTCGYVSTRYPTSNTKVFGEGYYLHISKRIG